MTPDTDVKKHKTLWKLSKINFVTYDHEVKMSRYDKVLQPSFDIFF